VDGLILRSGRILERVSQPELSNGRAIGRVFSYRDISLRIGAESQLRLASKVFESSLEAILITGPDFQVVASNPACERLTCLAKMQLIGSNAGSLFFDPNDRYFFDAVSQRLTHEGSWQGRLWLGREGQSSCAIEVSWVALRDEQGVALHTIAYFKDLTEELAAQKRIEQLAYSDSLTGLPNRLLLAQRVEFALHIAERNNGQFGVFFLDLDRFKNINDSMGHAFGDRVLIEVAHRIKQRLRDVDTLCRLGGDEFAVFLDGVDQRGAEIAARRILEALSQPFKVDEMSFSVGCSIGVALYPQDGRSLDTLIKCADTAMYQVKEQGRGNFRFYQPQMNADILSRMKMEHAMRQALTLGLFRLHYQPQICLQTGELRSAEALIRWTDAELGEVSPAVFIPLAEESGLIINIGDWVLDEAVRQAALWQTMERPVTVSINVSALQFQQSNFVERIAGALHDAGLSPHLLELEMTESILVKDANDALDRLHELAALGVGLSIDDFGTGYSSLAYLKKFPITKLKIDRSFVMGLPGDESDRAIVSATIGMARALKLAVVAEGVETPEQRDYLAGLKCESFQGFLCSPGLRAADFEKLVAKLPGSTSVAA
jgi:diguanylate cyclase (GGDEF)-like protein/PAS domain S-box-containing protein